MKPFDSSLLQAFDKFVGIHRSDLSVVERLELADRVCQKALDELLEGKDA